MKKRVFAATIFFLLAVFFCGAASAAGEKFVRVYRDDSYDMYLNTNALVQNRGVISCWIKVVLSDKGKAGLRQDLPAKYKQARIDYDLDYLRNWTLKLDLHIILKTVLVVFKDQAAY